MIQRFYCRRFDFENIDISELLLGSGQHYNDSFSENDSFPIDNVAVTNSNVFETTHETFKNSNHTTDLITPLKLIPDACHYWDEPTTWTAFIFFNFIAMFVLPLVVSIIFDFSD